MTIFRFVWLGASWVARLLCWPLALFGVFLFVACHWIGQESLLFHLEYVVAPWTVIALTPLVPVAALFRLRVVGWVLLAVVVGLGLPYGRYFVPRQISSAQNRVSLKVLTFNTWGTERGGEAGQIAYLLYTEQPDIAILQEVSVRRLDQMLALLKVMDSRVVWRAIANDETDQAIVSRHPLVALAQDAETTQLLSAQVQTALGDVVVWNVHAYRQNFLAHVAQHNILSYDNISDHRDGTAQFTWLAGHIAKVQQPLIVAGDLNVVPFSREYDLIADTLSDAYAEAGWGLGFTFPATPAHALIGSMQGRTLHIASHWPVAQIDHIFHNSQFAARRAVVLPATAGSDHRPMVAELVRGE